MLKKRKPNPFFFNWYWRASFFWSSLAPPACFLDPVSCVTIVWYNNFLVPPPLSLTHSQQLPSPPLPVVSALALLRPTSFRAPSEPGSTPSYVLLRSPPFPPTRGGREVLPSLSLKEKGREALRPTSYVLPSPLLSLLSFREREVQSWQQLLLPAPPCELLVRGQLLVLPPAPQPTRSSQGQRSRRAGACGWAREEEGTRQQLHILAQSFFLPCARVFFFTLFGSLMGCLYVLYFFL